jgi:hypothetical protein
VPSKGWTSTGSFQVSPPSGEVLTTSFVGPATNGLIGVSENVSEA